MSIFYWSNYIAWILIALIVIYLVADFSKVEKQRRMIQKEEDSNGKG